MSFEDQNKKEEDQSKHESLQSHHVQLDLCRTRPAYRQGRDLKAVKTYSITSESNHLLVFGVPKINLRPEIKVLFQKYGKILSLTVKNYNPMEEFTECFHVVYERFQSARVAKKCLDARSFYGGSLHICYAPELETAHETKCKLIQRRNYVRKQVAMNNSENVKQKIFVKAKDNNMGAAHQSNVVSFDDYALKNQCIVNYKSNVETEDADSHPSNSSNLDIITQTSNLSRKRSHNSDDDKEYVFKRKKKNKKGNKKLLDTINDLKAVIEESQTETMSSRGELNDDVGKVIVYDKLETPRVVNVPKKPVNKIILKINTKLI